MDCGPSGWGGLPVPSSGDPPDPGIEPDSTRIIGKRFTAWANSREDLSPQKLCKGAPGAFPFSNIWHSDPRVVGGMCAFKSSASAISTKCQRHTAAPRRSRARGGKTPARRRKAGDWLPTGTRAPRCSQVHLARIHAPRSQAPRSTDLGLSRGEAPAVTSRMRPGSTLPPRGKGVLGLAGRGRWCPIFWPRADSGLVRQVGSLQLFWRSLVLRCASFLF